MHHPRPLLLRNHHIRHSLSHLRTRTSPFLAFYSANIAKSSYRKMAETQTIVVKGVAVDVPEGLTHSLLDGSKPFNTWLARLQDSLKLQELETHPFHKMQYALQGIEVLSYSIRNSKLGFFTMQVKLLNGKGEVERKTIFMRGPCVAMLVMLIPDDKEEQEERYVLFVEQPRFAAGSLVFRELPAGMVEENEDLEVAAAREIQEELGLEVEVDKLRNLTELVTGGTSDSPAPSGTGTIAELEKLPNAIYPSVGGCDENITYFAYEHKLSRTELKELDGRHKGLEQENERITVRVVPMRDLVRECLRDSKALNAKALWDAYKPRRKCEVT